MKNEKTPGSNEILSPATSIPLGWPPENLLKQKRTFRRAVIWDCHGPLYDWATEFCEVAGELYNMKLSPAAVKFYYMGYDADFPLTPRQFNYAFTHMVRLRHGYGWLKAQPHAIETIRQVHEAGIHQEIWTYVPSATDNLDDTLVAVGTGISQSETYDLIRRDFPFLGDPKKIVRFIKPEAKAREMAKDRYPLIIEDCPSTAVKNSVEYGNATILYLEPYNQYVYANGIYRLSDRSQAASVILDFDKKMQAAGSYEFGR